MDDNIIIQLSIFVNNEPGRLAQIAPILKNCDINMRIFNMVESTEFSIRRAIVEDPDAAFEKLKSTSIIVKKINVMGVVIQDVLGSLFQAADIMGRGGINIEYGYAYTRRTTAAFFRGLTTPGRRWKCSREPASGSSSIRRFEAYG